MLRASIRSAFKKYKKEIVSKVFSGSISSSTFESEMSNIKHALEFVNNPIHNHHKMMRKELTMNIFPFGNDGTDPSTVIKLVCFHMKIILILYHRSLKIAQKLS